MMLTGPKDCSKVTWVANLEVKSGQPGAGVAESPVREVRAG